MFKYFMLFTLVLTFAAAQVDARPFRPGLIPNGSVNQCMTCHTVGFPTPGNGPRNAFGEAVESRVTPNGQEAFWGPALAALDSDGDGFTNGEELGDPQGAWTSGPAPGHRALVSRPGDASSTPPRPQNVVFVNAQVNLAQANAPVSSTTFRAALSGANEVPAVTTSASGTGVFLLDREGLHYRITVNGLSGAITGAHFHNAAAGSNGGVIQGITAKFKGNTATGTWAIGPGQTAELLAGRIYVNVHTAANPGGEIRGQVTLNAGVGFGAELSGDQEVPEVATGGSGTGAFVLDATGLRYWITVNGLSGPISAAHFHNAAAGENGGVVRAITFEGNTASGTWATTDEQALTPELIDALITGRIYVNVHTAANPGGEIRGQVLIASGVRMVASLSGANEVPAVTTSATGTASLAWGASGLSYRVTVNGLSGPISAAHFHNAAAGENGGVVKAISFTGNTAAGTWRFADFQQPLTRQLLMELLAGRIYVNVHTAANPGGEIRGQATITPGVGFRAAITGGQEVPAVTTAASGTAALNWNADGLRFWITVDGLSGPITASHFHNAPAGSNGGVVRTITFTGNSASGTWQANDSQPFTVQQMASLRGGNLYINVHTAANPGGEIRGQVLHPTPVAQGLRLAFSRSISGRPLDFAWSAPLNASGAASVTLNSGEGFIFRRVGASGYYQARLTNVAGIIEGEWSSIPLRGGRSVSLLLTAEGKAAITGPFFGTPLQGAGKHVSVPAAPTPVSGLEPVPPVVSFGAVQTGEEGTLSLPVHIARAYDLAGGDFTLTFDPERLSFRTGAIQGKPLSVTESAPGSVTLAFDAPAASDRADLTLSFDIHPGQAPGSLRLNGLFFDPEAMPIAMVDLEAVLDGSAPQNYALLQNYPNPFNPATQIRYDLPQSGQVQLTVYNALGQEVTRLVDARQSAGSYAVTWNAAGFASGLYYYRLEAGAFQQVRKMMLLK